MASTDYVKQAATEPAYPEMLWSKPETKRTAGKLFIIGGNAHGITAPLRAHELTAKAGVGHVRILLPDALKPITGQFLEQGTYAPSTPSGSLSQRALAELLDGSNWADGTLLPGDLGRNSETAILIEKFIAKNKRPTIATKDAADYITNILAPAAHATELHLVLSLSQLQKYAKAIGSDRPITFDMNLPNLIDALSGMSRSSGITLITKHHGNILLAHQGIISVTRNKNKQLDESWRLLVASHVAVWLTQQPAKPFEAMTTAIWEAVQTGQAI